MDDVEAVLGYGVSGWPVWVHHARHEQRWRVLEIIERDTTAASLPSTDRYILLADGRSPAWKAATASTTSPPPAAAADGGAAGRDADDAGARFYERLGDHALNIARRAVYFSPGPLTPRRWAYRAEFRQPRPSLPGGDPSCRPGQVVVTCFGSAISLLVGQAAG